MTENHEAVAYISQEQLGLCAGCCALEDLRMGFCWDCASAGEARAARRSVAGHVFQSIRQIARGRRTNARISLSWAWERLTGTGDYRPGGEFSRYRQDAPL